MDNETVAVLQLIQTKGLGPRSLDRLFSSLREQGRSLAEFLILDPAEMASDHGIDVDAARFARTNRNLALQLADRLDQAGIRVLTSFHDSYPRRLSKVLATKAPPVLFLAGNDRLLDSQSVGFCGARGASKNGLRCAAQASLALVRHSVTVVSGHAAGVDATAHHAALETSGNTVFVLPEGILHFRPRDGLSDLLTPDNYLVVSEFPPKLPWSVANAMQRNRTLCGLVDALIVIEAGVTGGTFAAAESALSLGIPLFVLEFPDPAPSARGNSVLLRRGGVPLLCLPDREPDLANIIQAMHLEKPRSPRECHQPSLFDYLKAE